MSIVFLRALILYILVIFSVRLMGKRQLGELQPSELVITILVSNIATLPLEDINIPLSVGITPILALVCFEVIMSWITLKIPCLRKIVSGRPKIIISNGIIDRKVMRELRFSVDDLMTALRGNDIFSPDEVQFAIVETTGNMSVLKKASAEPPSRSDTGVPFSCSDPPQIIISDGRLMERAVSAVKLTYEKVEKILKKHKLKTADVLIMTIDNSGNYYIADIYGNPPVTGGRSS